MPKNPAESPEDKVLITHPQVGGGKSVGVVTREQFDVVYKDKGWSIKNDVAEGDVEAAEQAILRSGEVNDLATEIKGQG